MAKNKQGTEKAAPQTTVTRVQYWPVQKPFVGRGPYPATVLEDLDNGNLRLSVSNPATGRQFHVTASRSEKPASGCFTEEPTGEAPAPAASSSSDGPQVSTTIS
jgi:hypothetical protein